MVVVALLSVDLVESVDLVFVDLVVNCIGFFRSSYVNNGDADILFGEIGFLKSVCGALL